MKTCRDMKTEKSTQTRLGWYLSNKTLPYNNPTAHVHIHVVTCAHVHVQVLVVLTVQSVITVSLLW